MSSDIGTVSEGVEPADVGRALRKVVHLSREERAAKGKAARTTASLASQAAFDPEHDRPDPIAQLEGQAVSRVPELVPIRYGRMVTTPFAFYRGAALVMAWDLSRTPSPGLRTQICGDAHMTNFGVFGSPERRLLFDLNDFDETAPGPFEWDVKRLAASLEIAGRLPGTARGRDLIDRAGSPAHYAHALARALEKHHPDLVVSSMSKDLRPGKVFVDWSQNNPAKTTLVPWSLRGGSHPTAATPVTWQEAEAGDLRHRTMADAMRLAAR